MPNEIMPSIVRQHVEDAAFLRSTRTRLAAAPHINLAQLRRHDERIAAHLDGVAVAGDEARPLCEAMLTPANSGAVFVAALRVLKTGDSEWLQQLLLLAESRPECCSGLSSAFGWAGREQLRGLVRELLISDNVVNRYIGITACSLHRVDPGLGKAQRFEDPMPPARARTYRIAGELGRREFVSRVAAGVMDEDSDCQFWASWAAVLLGDREQGLDFLENIALQDGPCRLRALHLTLTAMALSRGERYLRTLEQDPAQIRWLIRSVGLLGEPAYGLWLIEQMRDARVARLAGEAFTFMTGVDLSRPPFECPRPEGFQSTTQDDPAEDGVAIDEDEDLPWPDPVEVQHWWSQNGGRFAVGVRHFMGAPVTRGHCLEVLKKGYQRQRILAAYHLCMLSPGQALFEWRAPAWRQQSLLAGMT
jgi:uncharacterized protein (TIGR02270 family)